jgi:hypothetical protein
MTPHSKKLMLHDSQRAGDSAALGSVGSPGVRLAHGVQDHLRLLWCLHRFLLFPRQNDAHPCLLVATAAFLYRP